MVIVTTSGKAGPRDDLPRALATPAKASLDADHGPLRYVHRGAVHDSPLSPRRGGDFLV